MTATATKTSLKKWICVASNFIVFIPSRLIRHRLASFLEVISKGLFQSSGKEKESCCLVFPSSTKREIRHFNVVVVQRRLRNVQKSVTHVQSCCFADLNLFCRSRWRRRRRCLSSLILLGKGNGRGTRASNEAARTMGRFLAVHRSFAPASLVWLTRAPNKLASYTGCPFPSPNADLVGFTKSIHLNKQRF